MAFLGEAHTAAERCARPGPLRISFADISQLPQLDLPRSKWIAVEQPAVSAFADATDDRQWIHVDPARTQVELGTGTIVHGFCTLAMLVALTRDVLEVSGVSRWINYGLNRVRFLDPIPVGTRIRLHQRIEEVTPRGDAMMLTRHCIIETEHSSKPAMVADWIDLLYPLEAG